MKTNDAPSYPNPLATVDVVALRLGAAGLEVLVIDRTEHPFGGLPALPGGYVHAQEDVDALGAAKRVLRVKAGLEASHWEQLATFSGPNRDPRGWSLSVAHLAIVSDAAPPGRGYWCSVDALPALAFDHDQVVQAALARVRNRASYSSLPAFFLPPAFTLPQLQAVYERVFGAPLNTAAFRRKVADMEMLVELGDEEERPQAGRGRPAQRYRLATPDLQDFGRVVLSNDRRRRPGP